VLPPDGPKLLDRDLFPGQQLSVQFVPATGALCMALFSKLVSISVRRKLASILLAVIIFALLSGMATVAQGRPAVFAVLNAILVGTGVGLFEQFFVQNARGSWFRGVHPLWSILLYTLVVALLFLAAANLSHFLLHGLYHSPVPYSRLPVVLPRVIALAIIGIVVMRAVHFIGIDTLFHLMVGTYHRPVIEKKVIVFLDINDSTALAERLGAIRTQSLIGKFLLDVAQPITDHGGEIYLYKGDGLIALWDWSEAIGKNRMLPAIDAMFANVGRREDEYRRRYGVAPTFRVGIHGGDVVVSEQGDTKRSIGIYGMTINIASRMEEAAKEHRIRCAVSGDVAAALAEAAPPLQPIGSERIKGVSAALPIFEYRGADNNLTASAAARAGGRLASRAACLGVGERPGAGNSIDGGRVEAGGVDLEIGTSFVGGDDRFDDARRRFDQGG
jgi:adenylate cyclase